MDQPGVHAVALYSFSSRQENVLSVNAGDALVDYPALASRHWAYVMRVKDGVRGYLPPTHVAYVDEDGNPLDDDDDDDQGEGNEGDGKAEARKGPNGDLLEEAVAWQDDEFFGSYGSLVLQDEMLSDEPRTLAYERALLGNAEYLKGKRVMDVGCGSGILSLFAAKAGASKVFAMEASTMAHYARKTAADNGYGDVIQVVEGRAETADIGGGRVDLMVSEWMGTFLIFENMIESVIVARDTFLAPGGKMFPSTATLLIAPVTADETYHRRIGVWKSRYGFRMPEMEREARQQFTGKPLHDHVIRPSDLLSRPMTVVAWDMHTIQPADLVSNAWDFDFEMERDGLFHGIGSWFDVSFDACTPSASPVLLSTGPNAPLTHWKQDLLMLEDPVEVTKGMRLRGTLAIRRNPLWRRHYIIDLSFAFGEDVERTNRTFLMWR